MMDPQAIAQRLLGGNKPVTADRIAKLPRLIGSNADYDTLLMLLPDDIAQAVSTTAEASRAKGETTWVFS